MKPKILFVAVLISIPCGAKANPFGSFKLKVTPHSSQSPKTAKPTTAPDSTATVTESQRNSNQQQTASVTSAQGDPVPVAPKGHKSPERLQLFGFEIGMSPEEVAFVAKAAGYEITFTRPPQPGYRIAGTQPYNGIISASVRFQKDNEQNTLEIWFSPPPIRVVELKRYSNYKNGVLATKIQTGVVEKFGRQPMSRSTSYTVWAWDASGNPITTKTPNSPICSWGGFLSQSKKGFMVINENLADSYNKGMRAVGWGTCSDLNYTANPEGIANSLKITIVDVASIEAANDQIVAASTQADANKKQEDLEKASQDKPSF